VIEFVRSDLSLLLREPPLAEDQLPRAVKNPIFRTLTQASRTGSALYASSYDAVPRCRRIPGGTYPIYVNAASRRIRCSRIGRPRIAAIRDPGDRLARLHRGLPGSPISGRATRIAPRPLWRATRDLEVRCASAPRASSRPSTS